MIPITHAPCLVLHRQIIKIIYMQMLQCVSLYSCRSLFDCFCSRFVIFLFHRNDGKILILNSSTPSYSVIQNILWTELIRNLTQKKKFDVSLNAEESTSNWRPWTTSAKDFQMHYSWFHNLFFLFCMFLNLWEMYFGQNTPRQAKPWNYQKVCQI